MTDLTADDFPAYFRDVHGIDPFPWQTRLTEQILRDGDWPEVIDLPTGTGKTAVLDTAIFALAAQPMAFPRRIVFVIDRRIVVDQVYERARTMQRAISEARTPTLQRVREHLERVSDGLPLDVAMLRGGIPIDRDWAQRPDQPWVMVSTVDQFGSRLLFRGYGVSARMRPVYAGLTGNDCLVILDEVHLSTAFAQTLDEVRHQHFGESLPTRRFRVVQMSATARSSGSKFELIDRDLESSDMLRRRAQAPKAAILREASGTKQPHLAIPAEVKKILKSELDIAVGTVGVIVNRVRTARETYTELVTAGYSAHLITGRMRPLDRERRFGEIDDIVDPDRDADRSLQPSAQLTLDGTAEIGVDPMRPIDELHMVVATQAIEVGADFSFDALITEAAPIDSLRQRFGRLDRRGTLAERTRLPAKAWIIGVPFVLKSKRPDPIYGETVQRTWDELRGFEAETTDGLLDFSPQSPLPARCSDDCRAPQRDAPLLLGTYMDAWVQTDPEPVVQPAVDWFLHGIEEDRRSGDVSVVWRHDRSHEVLKLVPPRSAEFLEVPVDAARAWLSEDPAEIEVADIAAPPRAEPGPAGDQGTDWCRWQGIGDGPKPIRPGDIRPGDVLIVDPSRGGLRDGTWDPFSAEAVEDLGDEAQAKHQRRVTLRLDPRLYSALSGLRAPPSPSDEVSHDESVQERIDEWLNDLTSHSGCPDAKSDVVRHLQAEGIQIPHLVHPGPDQPLGDYYVLASGSGDPTMMDGSDESSSVTGAEVTLREHLAGVADKVSEYAKRLGLSDEMQSDLRLAAQLHDLGKVDSRFQRQMAGDDEVRQAMLGEELAKSLPGVRPPRDGWPPVRHEVMSVAMAESNEQILEQAYDRDLVLHLVGVHHGAGRPLPQINEDRASEVLRFEHDGHQMAASTDLLDSSIALDMADRFWRLNDRYGYHGLVWLEAILRLADQQRSADELTKQGGGTR